jgi:hypothetical protein
MAESNGGNSFPLSKTQGLLLVLAASVAAAFWFWPSDTDEQVQEPISSTQEADQEPTATDMQLVAPPALPDTSNLSLYAIDSIKLHRLFWESANRLSQAFHARNAQEYAEYAPPGMVDRYGGKAAYQKAVSAMWAQNELPQAVKPLSPLRVAAALDDEGYGHGWYALIPVRQLFGSEMRIQWLGAQTLDEGQHIYFIDISNAEKERIEQIMPDLHVALENDEYDDLRLAPPSTWPKL